MTVTTTKTAYLYVLDTMADWEPAHVTAELHSGRGFKDPQLRRPVRTVGSSRDPVVSMGGVTTLPDLTVDEVDPAGAALLLLPGGDVWLEPQHERVVTKAREFLAAGVPVGAICGATLALANAGILEGRAHTSNDLGLLKQLCPGYGNEAQYRHEPAVTDGDLVTAGGVNPLEFSYQVLARLDVFAPATLEAWYQLYKTGDAKYYFELMDSLQ